MKNKYLTAILVVVLILAMSLMLVACKDSKKDDGKDAKVMTEEEELSGLVSSLTEGVNALYNAMEEDPSIGNGISSPEDMCKVLDKWVAVKVNAAVSNATHITKVRFGGGVIKAVKTDGSMVDLQVTDQLAYQLLASMDGAAIVFSNGEWHFTVDMGSPEDDAIVKAERKNAQNEVETIRAIITDIVINDMDMQYNSADFAQMMNKRLSRSMRYVTDVIIKGDNVSVRYEFTVGNSSYGEDSRYRIEELRGTNIEIDLAVQDGFFVAHSGIDSDGRYLAEQEVEEIEQYIMEIAKSTNNAHYNAGDYAKKLNQFVNGSLEYVYQVIINGADVQILAAFNTNDGMDGMQMSTFLDYIAPAQIKANLMVVDGQFVVNAEGGIVPMPDNSNVSGTAIKDMTNILAVSSKTIYNNIQSGKIELDGSVNMYIKMLEFYVLDDINQMSSKFDSIIRVEFHRGGFFFFDKGENLQKIEYPKEAAQYCVEAYGNLDGFALVNKGSWMVYVDPDKEQEMDEYNIALKEMEETYKHIDHELMVYSENNSADIVGTMMYIEKSLFGGKHVKEINFNGDGIISFSFVANGTTYNEDRALTTDDANIKGYKIRYTFNEGWESHDIDNLSSYDEEVLIGYIVDYTAADINNAMANGDIQIDGSFESFLTMLDLYLADELDRKMVAPKTYIKLVVEPGDNMYIMNSRGSKVQVMPRGNNAQLVKDIYLAKPGFMVEYKNGTWGAGIDPFQEEQLNKEKAMKPALDECKAYDDLISNITSEMVTYNNMDAKALITQFVNKAAAPKYVQSIEFNPDFTNNNSLKMPFTYEYKGQVQKMSHGYVIPHDIKSLAKHKIVFTVVGGAWQGEEIENTHAIDKEKQAVIDVFTKAFKDTQDASTVSTTVAEKQSMIADKITAGLNANLSDATFINEAMMYGYNLRTKIGNDAHKDTASFGATALEDIAIIGQGIARYVNGVWSYKIDVDMYNRFMDSKTMCEQSADKAVKTIEDIITAIKAEGGVVNVENIVAKFNAGDNFLDQTISISSVAGSVEVTIVSNVYPFEQKTTFTKSSQIIADANININVTYANRKLTIVA